MKNKRAWIIAVVAGVIAPLSIWAASNPSILSGATVAPVEINCSVSGACPMTFVMPTMSDATESDRVFGSSGTATTAEKTTNWTGGSFSGDLTVGGTVVLTGTSTFDNSVSVLRGITNTMNTAVTSTACSMYNNSGVSRTIYDIQLTDIGTAASAGTVQWTVGTSTTSAATTTSALINAGVARSATLEAISTTSSVMSAYSQWKTGEYLNFTSGTTTNAGRCKVVFF